MTTGVVPPRTHPPLSDPKRRLLDRYLRGDVRREPEARAAIPRRPPGSPAPLSAGQHQVWLHSQLAGEVPLYNESVTIHRRGSLDVPALRWSLGEILRRHEAWRSTVEVVDGEPLQLVHEQGEVDLPLVDVRALSPTEREAEAVRVATEDAFDLARGPLVRFRLVRLGEEDHRLYVTLHHVVFDGVAMYSVFLPELVALYEARCAGRPAVLPELPIQYADFARWQHERGAEDASSADLDYWRRQLQDAPAVLELPADRPRPAAQSFRGAQPTFALSRELSHALKALSQREGATLFMTLLAAFNVLLFRYTGQDDLLVGTVTTRRSRPELERLLGFFLNTLVMRTRLSEDLSFHDLLGRVRQSTLDALAHDTVGIERVIESLQPERDPSRSPLFQVMFVLEPPLPPLPAGWDMTQMDVDIGIARVDLYLEADDRPEGIVGRVRYRTDLFDAMSIERLLDRFRVLLEGIVADPGQRLAALPILAPADHGARAALATGVAPTQPFVAFPPAEIEQSIAERFHVQAEARPGRLAVEEAGGPWTYAALAAAADRVAAAVSSRASGPDARIALLLDHDAAMVAGVLGVLQAGAAYVPLDATHPAERLALIVADSRPSLLLASRRNLDLARALAGGREVLSIDGVLAGPAVEARRRGVPPDRAAYVLYTSGSTGRPKGVLQSHRNVLHFIRAYTNNLHLSPDDGLTLLSSYSVDAAVMDIFGALLNGAALCPIDVRSGGVGALVDALRRRRITVYHSTPTVYRLVLRGLGEEALPDPLRLVVLGGEEVRREDVVTVRDRLPRGCLIVNGFGPTESTVSLQHFIGRETRVERPSVPVGRPVEETEVLLLSARGDPGQLHGEIAIRSPHVALGYWGRPDLTAAAFLPDPEGGARRVYRTGDMGRLLPDGNIEFAGRRDRQVKVRGFRIELGEIEAALGAHAAVAEAAAAVPAHRPGESRIVAYWVPRTEARPSDGELRRFLRDRLPEYMVPSAFVALPALPLTPSGKLDRRALPVPADVATRRDGRDDEPRDALELQLARLWEEVLDTRGVGRRDHFFELGGHSLAAVRLFAEIDRRFGVGLPLATLFKAPTVEQLAAVLREKGRSASASSLVPLQPLGSRPPLFGVHGHSGEVLFYSDLSRRLGTDQPFYALQAHGRAGRAAPRTIEEMARHYLDQIRRVQPRGPYSIGGYCMGAFLAFEMAQQLHAQGEEVALLAFFVGYSRRPRRRSVRGSARRMAGWLASQQRQLRALGGAARLRHLLHVAAAGTRAATGAAGRQLWRAAYRLLGDSPRAAGWLAGNVEEINLQAARRYAPRPYAGRLTVFLSGQAPPGLALDPARDLAGMAGSEMHVIPVPGDTDTMMKEPHVTALGAQLAACLQRRAGSDLPSAS